MLLASCFLFIHTILTVSKEAYLAGIRQVAKGPCLLEHLHMGFGHLGLAAGVVAHDLLGRNEEHISRGEIMHIIITRSKIAVPLNDVVQAVAGVHTAVIDRLFGWIKFSCKVIVPQSDGLLEK